MTRAIRKVLVANRGEIAVRVNRALRELNIASVAVYSDVDRNALHVQTADEAAHIGAAASSESYLNIDRVLDAARRHGADAIHPGYGFLSENATFAKACEDAGIKFIGPSSSAIARMGSKTEARALAHSVGAPTVPGTPGGVSSALEATEAANRIGYPVILKAAAGGGGKGMRRVDTADALESALRDASSEALNAFRSSEVYLEKYIERPRHVEIQVLGDEHGHMIHLGERECSVQRRHQKVIEESPSPGLAAFPGLREKMGAAAIQVAQAAGYTNAGTVEFLLDASGRFYFLEMNTRLQVEHPVTELVTGLDLVHWQIRIAQGEPLTLQQSDGNLRGHAMECRIYAEDPENLFFPSPGLIQKLNTPAGPGVRLDSGVFEGWTVPIDYDPLLAKLAVWSSDRTTAIQRLQSALNETTVSGIRTNISFFRRILADAEFVAGRLHTGFIDEFFAREKERISLAAPELQAVAIAAFLHSRKTAQIALPPPTSISRWLTTGRKTLLR